MNVKTIKNTIKNKFNHDVNEFKNIVYISLKEDLDSYISISEYRSAVEFDKHWKTFFESPSDYFAKMFDSNLYDDLLNKFTISVSISDVIEPIDFLRVYDPQLIISMQEASKYYYDPEFLTSEILANLLYHKFLWETLYDKRYFMLKSIMKKLYQYYSELIWKNSQ
mgnify:CR=1 FL=1